MNVRPVGQDDAGKTPSPARWCAFTPLPARRALYVNRNFTEQIVGGSRLESDAILGMLYSHSERDDFKCRFKWRPNSMAFWDNRCTLHLAIRDYYPQKRYGHCVTVKGTKA